MIKLNENAVKIPFKTKRQVRKTQNELKKTGYSELVTKTNKKGDVAILAYKTPEHDELVLSSIIKPDGKQTMTQYRSYPAQKSGELSTKIIDTWDKVKDDYIFNKRVTMQFKDSKIPEVISTMYSDINSDDGVKIITRFPHKEYMDGKK